MIDEDMMDEPFILCLAGAEAQRASASHTPVFYLLRVKSAFASPDTATGLDWLFAPSCQAVAV
jgi:hypothetical protein